MFVTLAHGYLFQNFILSESYKFCFEKIRSPSVVLAEDLKIGAFPQTTCSIVIEKVEECEISQKMQNSTVQFLKNSVELSTLNILSTVF